MYSFKFDFHLITFFNLHLIYIYTYIYLSFSESQEILNKHPPAKSSPATMNRYTSPSSFLTPPLLIIILPITALLLLIFLLPSFLSISSQIFQPTSSVRKSWDSINIFLVLFAILCGVFARRNDDASSPDEDEQKYIGVGNVSRDAACSKPVSVSDQWFDQYDHPKIYDTPPLPAISIKRNSSSYPDLRHESLWETGDERFRVFDDFEISKVRSSAISSDHRQLPLRRTQSELEHERTKTKVIPVDTFVLRHPLNPPTTPPPPPPPPPPAVRQKPRRIYHSIRNEERVEKAVENNGITENKTSPATPPRPPPPPPPPSYVRRGSEQRYGKLERRKSNATKEIKMVLSSFIQNQRKRKKKLKTKSAEIRQDHLLYSPPSESSYYNQSTAPATPLPPPPPPPSVFHGLFRKASKNKRVHSVPAPPPAPPPSSLTRSSKPKIHVPPPPPPPPAPATPTRGRIYPTATRRPPLPTRGNTFYEENINSGNQSPMIPMPPSPPPPPFKMPGMRFVVRAGFVKIGSSQSSRCSSPELEDTSLFSGKEESETTSLEGGGSGGCGGGSVFCPSPDVNVKADSFIARLRDEWRLEKMNSMREKGKMVAFASA